MPQTAPTDHQPVLALGPAAVEIRRALGAIAWVVLEHLRAVAETCDDGSVSHESVRGIATELDLANDTVARALRRLAAAGLTEYGPSRSLDGRFSRSHSRLTFPADLFLSPVRSPRVVEAPPTTAPTNRRRPSRVEQLSLIEPAPNGS
ncbi:MAG: hypothetical protein AB7P22_15540 [Vicinamibacterales bacterium]